MIETPLPPGFEARGVLGRGGTALVIRAFWEKTGQEVALKLPLKNDSQSVELFQPLAERESTLIGSIRYPGISRLLYSDTTLPCLTYEICKGPTLDSLSGVQPSSLVASLLSAIAINLEFLRLQGLVHADLKPQNIFLPVDFSTTKSDAYYRVKLSDFSLGRHESEDESSRAGLGTVGYMAPETISESITTHQSDLFALGVIGYQLLTGQQPFLTDDCDPVRSNSQTIEHNPLSPHEIDRAVNKELSNIVTSLLQKKPTDRPRSGWEVCQLLESTGCPYPFRKVLNPSFCINDDETYDSVVARVLRLTDDKKGWLDSITDRSANHLRLVMTANFNRDNLHYNGSRFEFNELPYWPARLRRTVLRQFAKLSYTDKKKNIISSLMRMIDTVVSSPDTAHTAKSSSIQLLLPHLLSPCTVKRVASQIARSTEVMQQEAQQSLCHMIAGNFDLAIETGSSAVTTLLSQHKVDEAQVLLNRLIEYGIVADNTFAIRLLIMNRADLFRDSGDIDNAMNDYQWLLELYKERPPDRLLAETYKDLGDLYKSRQDFAAGIEALEKALAIYELGNHRLDISHTLNNIGNMHWIASNLPKALIYYRAALRIQRELGADTEVASSLTNIGSIFAMQGRYSRAISIMNRALSLKKEIGNVVEIARSLNNLGYTHHINGDQHKAVDYLKESLELNRRTGTRKEILYNLENLTAVMITAGQLAESLTYLKEGLTLSNELGDLPHSGAFNLSMATVLRRLGRINEAQRCIEHVKTVTNQVDDRILPVTLMTNQAQLARAIGNKEVARKLGQEALKSSEELEMMPEQLNALLLLISVDSGMSDLKKAEQIIDQLGLTRERTLAHFNHLASLIDDEKISESVKWGESILDELDELTEDIEQARMCNLAANIKLAQGDSVTAMKYLHKSLSEGRRSQLLFEQIDTLTMIGQIESTNGDFECAFGRFKDALSICKSVAEQLTTDSDRVAYLSQRSIRFLTQEIKRLSQVIGLKKGQA